MMYNMANTGPSGYGTSTGYRASSTGKSPNANKKTSDAAPPRKQSAYDSFNLGPKSSPPLMSAHQVGGYMLNLPKISENPPSPTSPNSPHNLGAKIGEWGYADKVSPAGVNRIVPDNLRHGSNMLFLANLPAGLTEEQLLPLMSKYG